jgi:hypothetical protein
MLVRDGILLSSIEGASQNLGTWLHLQSLCRIGTLEFVRSQALS